MRRDAPTHCPKDDLIVVPAGLQSKCKTISIWDYEFPNELNFQS
jgi:hypothetical protein